MCEYWIGNKNIVRLFEGIWVLSLDKKNIDLIGVKFEISNV